MAGCIAALTTGLLLATTLSATQPALDPSHAGAPRVVVLPFADYANMPTVIPEVMSLVRAELHERGVELAEAPAVSDVLRLHRIRNTHELTGSQLRAVTSELNASHVLVGAVESYVRADMGGEVALAARLIEAPGMTIEWTGSASRHTLNGLHLLDQGRERDTGELARDAVRSLFKDFEFYRTGNRRQVDWVEWRAGGHSHRQACDRVMVVPFANESDHLSAGGIVTGRVIAALPRAGFEIIEPGLVREAMLAEGSLARGGASAELMRICAEQLQANFILTGSVSRFDGATEQNLDQVPAVAVEARLIDVRSGEVVWARTVRGNGSATNRLFGTGTVYDAASVADRVAAKLVRSIPAHRSAKPDGRSASLSENP